MTPASAKELVANPPEYIVRAWAMKRTLLVPDGLARCNEAEESAGTNKDWVPVMAGNVPTEVTILASPERVTLGAFSKPSWAKRPGSATTVMAGNAAISKGRFARSPPVALNRQLEP